MGRFASLAVLAPALAAPVQAQTTTPVPANVIAPLVESIRTFDWKTERVVLALPPGFVARGPYAIHATVKGDGAVLFEEDFSFEPDSPGTLSHPSLPPTATILRLSAAPSWPDHLARINKAMDDAKAKFAEGKRQASFDFKMNLKIEAAWREGYCTPPPRIPVPKLFVENTKSGDLRQIDMGQFGAMMVRSMAGGCAAENKPPASAN